MSNEAAKAVVGSTTSTERLESKGIGISPRVEVCDFRKAGKLSDGQIESMSGMYREFAEQLSNSLSAYLRSKIEVSLDSVQQIIYREFLRNGKEPGYAIPLDLSGLSGKALMQVDSGLSCSLVELLLGAEAPTTISTRPLTEIDQRILSDFVQFICRHLESAWHLQRLSITAPPASLRPSAMLSLIPESERVILFLFTLKIGEAAGGFALLLPTVLASSLLRAEAPEHRGQQAPGRSRTQADLRERVLDCPFTLSTAMSSLKLTVEDLISLKPGSVLKLNVPVKAPCALMLGGREQFAASPVRSGGQRAAQLLKPLQSSEPKDSKK